MEFADVIFPLNLRPLTYRVPPALMGSVRPGAMVSAEVKKSVKKGIVLEASAAVPSGRVKELKAVEGEAPALSAAMLRLIRWMAGYYFSTEGSVLKGILPAEFFHAVKARSAPGDYLDAGRLVPPAVLTETVRRSAQEVGESAFRKAYRTFLLHAPSTSFEVSFLLEAAADARNVIVLIPDRAGIEGLAASLAAAFGGRRIALLHGGLSAGRRSEELGRIARGEADIVVGSRGAVFAPLRDVSLIAVLREESAAYKAESGVRYGARDIAVMRGWHEGATVLLSSICPSVESFHNASAGKYFLIEPREKPVRPKVKVMDMRGKEGVLSRALREAASSAVRKGERVLLYINRKGFSLLECRDCGFLAECPDCGVPLMFHKSGKALRCGYCGRQSAPPQVCPSCGSHRLGPVGAGMERVEDALQELHPTGVDTSKRGLLRVIAESDSRLLVGTRTLTRSEELRGSVAVAGIINADAYRYFPDFRSSERAFQDFVYTAEAVKPGGQLIIQSRNPGAPLFRHLRLFNFKGFYREVLGERRGLLYPPFSRLALLSVPRAGSRPPSVGRAGAGRAQVLGPVAAVSKRGKKIWKVLVKAPDRAALRPAVEALLDALKGQKVTVDVDPVDI